MTQIDLKKFKFEVYPPNGKRTEWTVRFPDVNNIGGGGDTFEEALADAYENLEAEISYLEDSNLLIPNPEQEADYSGRVLVRLGKTTHKKASELAAKDGISLNQFLCNASNYYIASIVSTDAASELACSRVEDKMNKRADKMCDKYAAACNKVSNKKSRTSNWWREAADFVWSNSMEGGKY